MANLMNGDAFGHPTGGNFGIVYPETTLAYQTYSSQPLWPAEVWEGQIDVLVFVALLFYSSFPTRRARYSASTSCSTPLNGSSWNFSAATTST